MGFHLIIKHPDGTITPRYSETYSGLTEFSGITADSIIYQGEPHWTPVVIGQDDRYKNLKEGWYRAGIKAQNLFKIDAIKHGLMVEELSQDRDSFKAYTSSAEVSIKRGDFLLRNVRNMEVETKCFTFYNNSFYIEYANVMRHINMQTYSGSPVALAIYERDGDSPIPESLSMMYVQTILDANNKSISYDSDKKCFIIPLDLTKQGFTLIDEVRNSIDQEVQLTIQKI